MQPVLILPLSPIFKFSYSTLDWDESTNISGKFANNSRKKLKIDFKVSLKKEENLRNEAVEEKKQVVHGDNEDRTDEKEEEEFSFNSTNSNVLMVSADDLFINGIIRPVFPIITDIYDSGSPLRPPLKKLSRQRLEIYPPLSVTTESEDLNRAPQGRYSKCPGKLAVDASLEKCKKSNSIGFSKLWRFRELFHRRKSDRKDAAIFFNPPTSGGSKKETEKVNKRAGDVIKAKAPKSVKIKAALSASEKYYLNNRAEKESDKRRSYLPYKFGFIADVNGMSRKVHPF